MNANFVIYAVITKKFMENKKYIDICLFLTGGILPTSFTSTKANFLSEANNYQINARGNLMRNGRFVVKKIDRQKIFQEMHCK